MQANEWGPPAWKFLHMVSFGYPQDPDNDTKDNYRQLFSILRYTLPCSHCRKSYTEIYKYICIDQYLDSREGLTFWLFIIHNLVNRKLKRDLANFEDVVLEYENYRARCGDMNDIAKYSKCKNSLKEIKLSDIQNNVLVTYSKYKEISKKQIEDFYKSENIIDPKFIKCSDNCNNNNFK
jgi:hypothetical protein